MAKGLNMFYIPLVRSEDRDIYSIKFVSGSTSVCLALINLVVMNPFANVITTNYTVTLTCQSPTLTSLFPEYFI